MSVVVFAGPTLDAQAGKRLLDAEFLPPAGQGDVYRVARERPSAICIIDGTFERAPAIWHKEILWALSRGIHVFGASSMGALRAAELCAFGMVGVGAIFEWFRDGVLEDDDEVAISHAGIEHGYRATSEALVNIRATVQAALTAGALTQEGAATLLGICKRQYYPDRGYASLVRAARADSVPEATLEPFASFLERGKVNQKRLDACALLELVASRLDHLTTPFVPRFHFEYTETWDQVVHAARATTTRPEDARPSTGIAAWYEELRLAGLFQLASRGALLRAQARRAELAGFTTTEEQRRFTQEAFRRERSLESSETTRQWLDQNELSEVDFDRLMGEETIYRWFKALHSQDADEHLKTEMVAGGYFAAVKQRADEKHAVLAARGLDSPELGDAGLSMEELMHWFLQVRLGQSQTVAASRLLAELGFTDPDAFRREALREYLFLKFRAGSAEKNG